MANRKTTPKKVAEAQSSQGGSGQPTEPLSQAEGLAALVARAAEPPAATSHEGRSGALLAAWQQERDERFTALQQQARVVFRAVAGWQRVESEVQWEQICREAREQYRSAAFLL